MCIRDRDEPHRYAETVITVDCAGQSFTAKGKTVLAPGWKRYEQEQAEAAPAPVSYTHLANYHPQW